VARALVCAQLRRSDRLWPELSAGVWRWTQKATLYVANTNGNQVLVYNPSHEQVPAMTLPANLSQPTGVVFDISGISGWATLEPA
jgi:hypothetical protein